MDGKQGWTGVDRRHIAALGAIAEQGSFRAAADHLGYVQSAVSDQIAHLERCAGLKLVKRRKATDAGPLTEAGRRLLQHFETISSEFAAAEAEMAVLREGRAGSLRIGVFETAAERLLPGTLRRFQRARPEVGVELVEDSEPSLVGSVARGELDAAFGTLPLAGAALRWRQLLRDPYVLLVPADWPLARTAAVAELSQLSGLPLVGNDRSPGADLLEQELRAAGVEPEYVVRSGRWSLVRELVAAGVGAALVPRLAAERAGERTVVLELERQLSPRTVVLCWHADRAAAPGLDRFVELAAEQAERVRARSRRAPLVAPAARPAPPLAAQPPALAAQPPALAAQPATVTLIG